MKEELCIHKMRIVDTRPGDGKNYYRYRRYKCQYCPHKFTTLEFKTDEIDVLREKTKKYNKIKNIVKEKTSYGKNI